MTTDSPRRDGLLPFPENKLRHSAKKIRKLSSQFAFALLPEEKTCHYETSTDSDVQCEKDDVPEVEANKILDTSKLKSASPSHSCGNTDLQLFRKTNIDIVYVSSEVTNCSDTFLKSHRKLPQNKPFQSNTDTLKY